MSHDLASGKSDSAESAAISKADISKIFVAINAIADKVDTFNTSLTTRLDTLEKDLADGSSVGDGLQPTNDPPRSINLDSLFNTSKNTVTSNKRSLDTDCTAVSPKRPRRKKSKKKKKQDSSDSSSSSDSDQEVNPQLQEMIDDWEVTKPKYLEDPTTNPIQAPLAPMLETWFWSVYSNEEVKAELSKTSRPVNSPALIPTKINEAIFRSLNPQALNKDMPLRFIQNAFMKASQPVAVVWDMLIQIENHLKANRASTSITMSNDLTVDFQFLRKQLDQALRLLGIANSQTVVHRKEILSQFLNKDFKKICKKHIAFRSMDVWYQSQDSSRRHS